MKYTTEIFIERAKEVHGDKYDYSKVEYGTAHTKVIIGCPIHGDFTKIAREHYYKKSGCCQCWKESRKKQ